MIVKQRGKSFDPLAMRNRDEVSIARSSAGARPCGRGEHGRHGLVRRDLDQRTRYSAQIAGDKRDLSLRGETYAGQRQSRLESALGPDAAIEDSRPGGSVRDLDVVGCGVAREMVGKSLSAFIEGQGGAPFGASQMRDVIRRNLPGE